MGDRRAFSAVVVSLMAASASAGDHKFGAFAAPSYLSAKGSSLGIAGWHLSGDVTIPWGECLDPKPKDAIVVPCENKKHKELSLVGDLSVHFKGDEDTVSEETDPTQVTFAFGPRVEYFGSRRLAPFVQALLVGVAYRSGEGAASVATGAVNLGGGLTLNVGGRQGWALRAEVDYVLPLSNDLGQGWRYSLGVVYRFSDGKPHQH